VPRINRGVVVVFIETILKDVCIIELDRIEDERGFFARTFCEKDFQSRGLQGHIKQSSISYCGECTFNPNLIRKPNWSVVPKDAYTT
jgi:dTDP-4-dehydrorhamnose 3,5-epimerase-like enzyme